VSSTEPTPTARERPEQPAQPAQTAPRAGQRPEVVPEILAPAGDLASLRAALAAGADAVYFGLDEGFNARGRAANFALDTLPATVALIHRAGARAYLTLNTLVFEPELPAMERVLQKVAAAGVDAVIVQDPAVALLARAVCPALEVHGSTQMTVSSAEGARFAAGLGITRVVVPRELSVAEIRRLADELRATSNIELEVFIHGALCVSWSGQCLTSEAWGGRSANRGQCAQSCRMPYDLVVDGEVRELGDVKYLLSPQDLAGVRAVPALVDIGVHGLKIEGRQKGPQYVATAVEGYRRWRDAVRASEAGHASDQMSGHERLGRDLLDMALAYSRGFSDGFLGGSDHQTLVEGRFPRSRGVYLGRVAAVRGSDVLVAPDPEGRPWTGGRGLAGAGAETGEPRPAAPEGAKASPLPDVADLRFEHTRLPVRPGMGVVFDAGRPEDASEPGGPVFRADPLPGGGWRLGFGAPGPDLGRVSAGQRVWVTSDPAIARQTEKLLGDEPTGRHAVDLVVSGSAGEPLVARARSGPHAATAGSASTLAPARGHGLTAALLADKLAGFGGTPLRLGRLDTASLAPGLHLPVSELKDVRRRLAAALIASIERGPARHVAPGPVPGAIPGAMPGAIVDALRAHAAPAAPDASREPALLPLCRTDEQLDAVIELAGALGIREVELDWMEFVGLGRAAARVRAAGLGLTVATVRVQKVGEEGFDARIARLAPDAVLARHWGAVMCFRDLPAADRRPVLHGDFSLNVTNSITARHLFDLGLDTLTAAHDLDEAQLFALLDHVPAGRMTVVVHHHIPTFHTEHCVYAHLLSGGRDFRSCGRPCEQHRVSLRDRVGLPHPVLVDVGCRNTVFNAQAQSAAALVPRLLDRGVRRFRVELVRESAGETRRILTAYADLVSGRIGPRDAVRRAGAHEQFGVTRGTMRVIA
jgi:putative protease